MDALPDRDDLAERYLSQLPYKPYPFQEEALLTWFTSDQGVMVCAPTGMGKTLIAHAALFEALHCGQTAYYTTPLIALTEQKFREIQEQAVRWGFEPSDIGLVTGNRRVNPDARILVVVSEILLNRLLHPEAFAWERVAAVVMDEFHWFADPERGIVWELALSLLPKHIRLLLLSATVGNAAEFINWLDRCHGRKLQLVESTERKVPLTYEWIPDLLLSEQVVEMVKGDSHARKTPALVFCFNRDECWSVAEMFKGLPLVSGEQKSRLHDEVNRLNWTQGVGPKMKQLLHRGIGVHHAGLLPKYRRVVEDLFEKKLLSYVLCTETLAAGINLPARAVVLTRLVKGPPGKEKLIDSSVAHQIFGRAGRPQFDDKGYVIALADEDDVKILRWKEKFDAIPESTKDPNLIKAKKALKRKKPTRSENRTYWSENQFKQLQGAKPGKLYSKGPLPWRLLAYMLKLSPEVDRIRQLIRKRLLDEPRIQAGQVALERMLLTLHKAGFVQLEPEPQESEVRDQRSEIRNQESGTEAAARGTTPHSSLPTPHSPLTRLAHAMPSLDHLLVFRSTHPLYAAFLLNHLGTANRDERLQILESVLELPRSIMRSVRVPPLEDLPPGPLAARLDPELVGRGLILASQASTYPRDEDDQEDDRWRDEERPPTLAEKLFIQFEAEYPEVDDVFVQSVWAAGEVLRYGGNFNKYVSGKDLAKQEGLIFRHLLRLILLCEEFAQVSPKDMTPEAWQAELRDISTRLTASCREVDPESTDKMIEQAHAAADVVEGEEPKKEVLTTPSPEPATSQFGAGILDDE
jgi:superfamily II DNA/RNA helicase